MKRFIPQIVKEFFRALRKGYTYNVIKNGYAIFGILWGIPVPIVTIGIGLYFSGGGFSLPYIVSHIVRYPIHIFFLLHPILFGIVFGAMGTVREEKEIERIKYEKDLLHSNEELKKVNEKLRELDELKDSFLSMVSHELLSPLTTIQGYITFLKEEKLGILAEKQIDALRIVEEESDHLKYLIEELMDLSKIEAGKFEVKLIPIDITDIVDKVKDGMEPSLETSGITLDDKIPDELPLVLADSNRIAQVFSNLLRNAIKFTPLGGRISIYVRITDDKIVFCIEDTGIGIPKEKVDKIFDRFYQIDSSTRRRYGGCGLGLTITKNIIDMHKGRIWVDSEVGKGSRFFFELLRSSKVNDRKEEFKNDFC